MVSASRVVAAPAQVVFDILADPAQHAGIDGSGSVRGARDGNPERLFLGARFAMDMKIGARYRISNEVVEFEDGRLIAWRHFNGHVWRYSLEPEGTSTIVTEQWDPSRAKHRLALRLLGFSKRNAAAIRATLDRLAELVERQPQNGGSSQNGGSPGERRLT